MCGYALEMLYRVFIQGLSKENRILLETQKHVAHSRLVNEYGTTGLLAMLVKTITMGFVAVVGEYRHYFEVYEGAATEHTEHLEKHLATLQHHRQSASIEAFLGLRTGEGVHLKPVSFAYYVYAFLLMFATLAIFVAMMTSIGNYLALSLIDGKGLTYYIEKTGILADLPFLCLLWGVTIWHFALMVLMFFLVNFEFGVVFSILCFISIIIVVVSIAKMLEAVDIALEVAEKHYLETHPREVGVLHETQPSALSKGSITLF